MVGGLPLLVLVVIKKVYHLGGFCVLKMIKSKGKNMKNLLETEKSAEEIVKSLTEMETASSITMDKNGILKLEAGTMFKVILHPDGVNKLKGLINNGESFNYKEETGKMWSIRKENDSVIFNHRGNDKLAVDISRLKTKLN